MNPNSPILGLPREIAANILDRGEYKSIAALSSSCRTLHVACNEPMVYLRYHRDTDIDKVFTIPALPDDYRNLPLAAMVLRAQRKGPLGKLQCLVAHFDRFLCTMNDAASGHLSQPLKDLLDPDSYKSNYSAALELLTTLVRKFDAHLRQGGSQQKKLSPDSFRFLDTTYTEILDFIIDLPPARTKKVDRTKLHPLIGEILHSYCRAVNWDADATNKRFEKILRTNAVLTVHELPTLFALATQCDQDEQARPNFSNLTPPPALHASSRLSSAMLQMPISKCMARVTNDFESYFGAMDEQSRHDLGRVLARASRADVWQNNLSAAADAYACLFLRIGQHFRAHPEQREAFKAFLDTTICNLADLIITMANCDRKALTDDSLHRLAFETVCMNLLSMPAGERAHGTLDVRLEQYFVDSDLMEEIPWITKIKAPAYGTMEALEQAPVSTESNARPAGRRKAERETKDTNRSDRDRPRRHSAKVQRPAREKQAEPKPESDKPMTKPSKAPRPRSARMERPSPNATPAEDTNSSQQRTSQRRNTMNGQQAPGGNAGTQAPARYQAGSDRYTKDEKGNCILS